MGILFRLYLNALFKGNPLAVVPTALAAGVVGFAGLSEGVAQRDPVAIGVLAVVGLMFAALLVIGVIDRKLNPPVKAQDTQRRKSGTGTTSRAGRCSQSCRPGPPSRPRRAPSPRTRRERASSTTSTTSSSTGRSRRA